MEKRRACRKAELELLPLELVDQLEDLRLWRSKLEFARGELAAAQRNGNEGVIAKKQTQVEQIAEIHAAMLEAARSTRRRIEQWLR